MNEQPRRATFFGGCPHDCPDTCAIDFSSGTVRVAAKSS